MNTRKIHLLKCLILIILVLPMFYDYFKILPRDTKYVLDIFLLIYIFNSKDCLKKQSDFTRLYLGYVVVVAVIILLGIVIHNESITYFFLELRRLLTPLLLYYIVSDSFDTNKQTAVILHRFLVLILLWQIPVTLIQYLLYPVFNGLGLFVGQRYYLDAATGTLGGAGHSYLGILIPLSFIYLYIFKRLKYGIPLLIPLILISSGGGMVLFGGVLVTLVLYTLVNGSLLYRVRIIGGIALFIVLLVSLSQTKFIRKNINKYTRTYLFYQEHYIEGGRETFVGQEHKLSRFNGYKFLSRHMDKYDFEHLFGLGFEFEENKDSRKPYRYKNDINTFIAERGYLGLLAHGIFVMLFMLQIYGTLKKRRHKQIIAKMLFFATFFVAGFYNQTSRSATIWLIIVCFLALIEHPDQYQRLQQYISTKKKKLSSLARKTYRSGIQVNRFS